MGRYFTILGDMLKSLIKSFSKIYKYLGFLLFRILDRIVKLDKTFFVKKNVQLNNFHGGYFIIVRK